MTPLEQAVHGELLAHGPSRGPDLVAAFTELDGATVAEVVDALATLAVEGLARVEIAGGLPYWVAQVRP